jgi:hypothetical protein
MYRLIGGRDRDVESPVSQKVYREYIHVDSNVSFTVYHSIVSIRETSTYLGGLTTSR